MVEDEGGFVVPQEYVGAILRKAYPVNLLPCPFCGGQCIDTDFDSSFGWVLSCDECGARGPQLDKLDALAWAHSADENRAKAVELWNRRAVIDETEYWAGVIEQTVINGRAGFLEFARAYSRPGIAFTELENTAIKAVVAMGNTAEAQRMILDALEKALDIAPHS